MASIYTRKGSPFFWIRFKSTDGKWIGKATGYKTGNPGDRRQAEIVAQKLSIEERERTPASPREYWDSWVDTFLQQTYGHSHSTTLTVYRRYWTRLRKWLGTESLMAPAQLNYSALLRYKALREKQKISINSIVHELKFLGVLMKEAIHRGFATNNPCLRMGFKRTTPKPKVPWTDEQAAIVAAAIRLEDDFLQASFILGFYQAARLRQCAVPLKDIDLERRRITYWRTLDNKPLTKGNKPFTQPIAGAALPMLRELAARRADGGHRALCEIPERPSLIWREFLDRFGFEELCHHGLRTTWITKAARSGKVTRAEAMRFVNHGSTAVHEIYQRLNADDVAHVADALELPAFPVAG